MSVDTSQPGTSHEMDMPQEPDCSGAQKGATVADHRLDRVATDNPKP